MSLLIKGLNMPKGEDEGILIALYNDTNKAYILSTKETKEVVELPDHGDLVDRDKFISKQQSWATLIAWGHGDDDEWVKCIGEVCDHLYDAPVVIPTERSEE